MSQAASASEMSPAQSPSTQGPARGRRRRTASWSSAEVMDLIEVWGQAPNVHDLRTRRRNAAVYGRIAAAMASRGHRRTQEQVRIKIKQLRQAYARATRGRAAAGAATCPYFTALHQLLGGRAVRASPGDIEPGPEGPDLGTPEGSPPAVSSRETVPAAPAARAGRTTPPRTCSRTRGLLRTASTEQEYWDQHLGALQAVHRTLRAWMREDLQVRHELLAELRGLSTNLQLLLQSMVPRAGPAPAAPPTAVPPPTPAPPPTSSSSTPTTSSSMSTPPHLNLRTLRTLHPIPPGTPRPPPSPYWEAVGLARPPPLILQFPHPLLSLASPFQLPPPSFPPPLSQPLSSPLPPPFPSFPEFC
ncbi:uncharacterized protein LOC142823554 [Pelodiscus sinensis]|uniref:uncharacterized protein LOC142823554 n=1 Tax=Pelodiscus sinensis TaxID=13735 RepID=UPI003F6AD1C4